MDFLTNEYSFKSASGLCDIYAQSASPADYGSVKGVVQITHGMAEHSNRYGRFAVELCKNGYAVFICDLLGHGNSVSDDSELGYFGENGVESLVDDMKQLNDIARREYPGLPVYLFGHSMGSFLSRAYTAKYPDTIDGTIWCGTSGANPAAGLGIALARAIEKRSGDHHRSDFLNSLAFGKYNKRTENETQFDWLSKDKEEVKKYIDDDYCGFVFTANGFKTLFSLLKQISGKDWYRAVPNDKPIFLIAGENDPVGEYGKGVNEVFMTLKKTGHSSVEMKLYPGDRHELLNEIDRDAVTKDIIDWLNGQTKSSHVENAAEAISEK